MNSNQYRLIQNNCEALPRCSCVPSAQQQPVGAHINSALLFFSILLFIVSCQSPAKKINRYCSKHYSMIKPASTSTTNFILILLLMCSIICISITAPGLQPAILITMVASIFFAANQSNNSLYLNEGNLHFKNVTVAAKFPKMVDGAQGLLLLILTTMD